MVSLRSIFFLIQIVRHKSSRQAEFIYSKFDVGRSTCPQCLDGGVSRIQPFDLYIDVNTNQMHYAWQAGVRCSLVSSSIKLAAAQARGSAHIYLLVQLTPTNLEKNLIL